MQFPRWKTKRHGCQRWQSRKFGASCDIPSNELSANLHFGDKLRDRNPAQCSLVPFRPGIRQENNKWRRPPLSNGILDLQRQEVSDFHLRNILLMRPISAACPSGLRLIESSDQNHQEEGRLDGRITGYSEEGIAKERWKTAPVLTAKEEGLFQQASVDIRIRKKDDQTQKATYWRHYQVNQ